VKDYKATIEKLRTARQGMTPAIDHLSDVCSRKVSLHSQAMASTAARSTILMTPREQVMHRLPPL
jgi:hypothetical protein